MEQFPALPFKKMEVVTVAAAKKLNYSSAI